MVKTILMSRDAVYKMTGVSNWETDPFAGGMKALRTPPRDGSHYYNRYYLVGCDKCGKHWELPLVTLQYLAGTKHVLCGGCYCPIYFDEEEGLAKESIIKRLL